MKRTEPSMMVFKSEPAGFADSMRPAPRSRKKSLPDVCAFLACAPIGLEAVALMYRLPARYGVGLGLRVVVVRPPERREVPAEVQFEVAPKTVTDTTDLGTARLCPGRGQR